MCWCRYDEQVKELSGLFAFSSRLIVDGVETIEIPFESSRGGTISHILNQIKNEHGIVIAEPVTGSIVIRLQCNSFPASQPDICMTLLGSRGGHVLSDRDLQRYGILADKYEYVWGDPTVRLATIISNLWYSLGCVESPRKKEMRETCCLVDDLRAAMHACTTSPVDNRSKKNSGKNRLNVMFEKCRAMYSTLSNNSRMSESDCCGEEDDLLNGLQLDDGPCMHISKPREIDYSDVEEYVKSLTEDDIVEALVDPDRLEQMASSPRLSTLLVSRLAAVKEQNVNIAEQNIKTATELESLKKQIAILKSEYELKLAEFRAKNARQEKAREVFAPEVLIDKLCSSARETEKQSTHILERWKQNKISNDRFVKEYVDSRAKLYAYKKKHAWAVASIPIPRKSTWRDT